MIGDGKRRVLVVDDDHAIRDYVTMVLDKHDFEVIGARDGAEAMALAEAGEDFEVLLTDIRMPGIDGLELVRRMRELRPDLRVLFMSGYAARYKIDPDRDDFLAKPFRARELIGCVYEIMNRKIGR